MVPIKIQRRYKIKDTALIITDVRPKDKRALASESRLDCANKDLDGSLGLMGKFIEHC